VSTPETQASDEKEESVLLAISRTSGEIMARYPLDARPAFDGMIAVGNKVILSLQNGELVCFEGK
jgi:hypothetical protein